MDIRKILQLLLLFFCLPVLHAQILLSSQPLELKKSRDYHEIMAAPDAANSQLVVFAADKEKVTALRYNSVLFFSDTLTATRPGKAYSFMAGHSFNGMQAHVYWASDDFTQIQATGFDFTTRTVASPPPIEIPFRDEEIVTTFSGNDSFYIATLPKEDNKLILYVFNNGRYESQVIDLSMFAITTIENKDITIKKLLKQYGIRKIDEDAFSDLLTASSRIKLYVAEDELLLTLDHNATQTQVFSINTNTYSVTEKKFPHLLFNKAAEANSYYHRGRLYQLKMNEDQLALTATGYPSGGNIKSYNVAKNDSISFKNSPLLVQTGSQRPKEFKNTKKFLEKAASASPALSVYQTAGGLFVLVGGMRSVVTAGNALLGVAMVAAGGSVDLLDGMMDNENNQSIYFESLFDDDFEHSTLQPSVLAVDDISTFLNKNTSVSLQTVTPFGGYYVMGYYDTKAKQYVLRKFQDGY
jgi:hypothetical protein